MLFRSGDRHTRILPQPPADLSQPSGWVRLICCAHEDDPPAGPARPETRATNLNRTWSNYMSEEAFIYEAIRTPRGKQRKGALNEVKPLDLVVAMLGANDMKPFICGRAIGAAHAELVRTKGTAIGARTSGRWWAAIALAGQAR